MLRVTPAFLFLAILLAVVSPRAAAQSGVYQTQTEFLAAAFGSERPESKVVWFTDELRSTATQILGHPPAMLRMRYWYDRGRTAWIIDEIGKEKPITMGFVIEHGEIQNLSVLTFRESRGWEIRYPFFTQQFSSVALDSRGALDQRIDGITGATLSVKAATKSATLALALNEYVVRSGQNAAASR